MLPKATAEEMIPETASVTSPRPLTDSVITSKHGIMVSADPIPSTVRQTRTATRTNQKKTRDDKDEIVRGEEDQ